MIKSVYVINLDDDTQRMEALANRLDKDNIEYTRISAFDGRKLSRQELNDYLAENHGIEITPKVSSGNVGCFLSHYNIWKIIANSDEDYALVLEDDIHLSNDFKSFLKSDSWIPNNFDVVRFEVSTNRLLLSKTQFSIFNDRSVHLLKSTSWCAGAYVLSKACAKQLLALKLDHFISSDTLLFSYEASDIAKKLDIYQVTPALAIQDKYQTSKVGYASNIEKTGLGKKLKRKLSNNWDVLSVFNPIKKTLLGYKRIQFK